MTAAVVNPSPDQSPTFRTSLEQLLGKIFALRRDPGLVRSTMLLFILPLLFWISLALVLHFPTQETIRGLINPIDSTLSIPAVIALLGNIFFAGDVLLCLLAASLPFFIVRETASIYLQDIFDLSSPQIARRFINQAAFSSPDYLTLHIENGEVRREDRNSPLARIGGPGFAQVYLENMAVFDRIDGMCKIVGPTHNPPKSVHTLEGFECIRQIIDLRDHTSNFDFTCRTRDGIRIQVQDIRLLFSILRNTADKRSNQTFSFNHSAAYGLIFRQSYQAAVVPWSNALIGLVRSELENYIADHSLGELLSAVEGDRIKQHIWYLSARHRYLARLRRYGFFEKSHAGANSYSRTNRKGYPKRLPPGRIKRRHTKGQLRLLPKVWVRMLTALLIPRTELSKQFYDEFMRGFIHSARRKGVQLEWINVGTWHPLGDIVPTQHIEAFRMTIENYTSGNHRVLESLRRQATSEEILRLVRECPILAFIQFNKPGIDDEELINELIVEYLGHLRTAKEMYKGAGRAVPAELDQAIQLIERYRRGYIARYGRIISP